MAATKYLTSALKDELDKHSNKLENHEGRISGLEQSSGLREERIEVNRKTLEKICTKTDELENVVIAASFSIKVGTWIVAGFGISVIALIWSLITGQASIIFP